MQFTYHLFGARCAKYCLLLCLGAYLALLLFTYRRKSAYETYDLLKSEGSAEEVKLRSYKLVYPFTNGAVAVVEERDDPIYKDLSWDGPSSPEYLMSVFVEKALEISAECTFDGKFRPKDGTSWSICPVGPFSLQEPGLVFSFSRGIKLDVESTLANQLKCRVFAFDPTAPPTIQKAKENIFYLREGIHSPTSGATYYTETLLGHLKRFRAENVSIDVLKLNVGDSWLHVVDQAMENNSLRYVKQLLLSIPIDQTSSVDQLRVLIQIIKSLRQIGFRLWFQNLKHAFPRNARAHKSLSSKHIFGIICRQLHFINVNILTSDWQTRDASAVSKLEDPLAQLPVVKLPGFNQLEVIRSQNLSLLSMLELEELYFDVVRQLHVHCPKSARLGHAGDGGWDVCLSGPFDIAKRRPCVAFSFGIANIYKYDDQLAAQYKCMVYMFDPSMGIEDYRRGSTSWFFNTGLSANNSELPNGWKMQTLCTLFNQLGYADKEIDILKIDIEFWEWDSLEKALEEGCLTRVRQLMFETHTAGMFHVVSNYARFIGILSSIFDLGFANWNTHLNTWSVYSNSTGVVRPCCYEHYLINTKLLPSLH